MSKGRKNRTVTKSVTGTKREDLLGNLTLASARNSGRVDLTRDTKTFTKNLGLGWDDDSDVASGNASVANQAKDLSKTLVDISQENLDTLNIKFQQRAEEVLRRNVFQGREQLVLTNRV